uniref:CSON000541 protein n=2 Tax=Culicoides sonorensis TaxID=179676 RepID=A0A336MEX1_CULSO
MSIKLILTHWFSVSDTPFNLYVLQLITLSCFCVYCSFLIYHLFIQLLAVHNINLNCNIFFLISFTSKFWWMMDFYSNFMLSFFFSFIFVSSKSVVMANRNLTSIRWAHAVNSQKLLDEALHGPIDMIEADIVLGLLTNNASAPEQPVMGHPPANTSDISLEQFLEQILEFNNNQNNSSAKKGVKLDFKSTEVFIGSQSLLENVWNKMDYPVWINADILSGPVNNTNTIPVDPDVFLRICNASFPSAVLSIGWTTKWGPDYKEGKYEDTHIENMKSAITVHEVKNELTFPIRAGIAANSNLELKNLFLDLNKTNDVTMTIWSSQGDFVDVEKLRNLIFDFGLDKIYLDVPQELENQLRLDKNGSNSSQISTCLGFLVLAFIVLNSNWWKIFA